MRLFYRKYGEGPPLVILHGLFGSSDNWVTIGKKASGHFSVILPDQRNHGNSPHSDIHDYGSMSSDLYELVSDLKIQSFFLAGHSMGGKTAMTFALNWPGMIKGLLVADISPSTDENRMKIAREEAEEILTAILDTDLSKASLRDDVDKMLAERISHQRTRNLILKNLSRDEQKGFCWKLNAESLYRNLGRIIEGIPGYPPVAGFPVVFLKAGNSDYIREEDYSYIKYLFPDAEVKVIRNTGHWMHTDNPDAITDELSGLAEK